MTDPNHNDKKNPVDSVVDFVQNTSDHTGAFDADDIQKNKGISAVCYIPILFFLPLVVCPGSRFGRFHANQSLVLLIVSVIGSAAFSVIGMLFSLGFSPISFIISILSQIWGVLMLLLAILGAVNTVNGKAKELPVIGRWSIISG